MKLAAVAVPLLLGIIAAPADDSRESFRFDDREITESSALVALPGGDFATTNDSGDSGRVFTVNASGATVGVTTWSEDPTDVEALAQCDPGTVWVGDIGDNTESRDSVQIAEVPVGSGDRTVTPTGYDLVYPDGAHDAETLLCQPRNGRLFVATKAWSGGRIYAAPARLDPDGPNRLREVAPAIPMATDGAFFPDGDRLVLRGYFSASVYRWPAMKELDSFPLPTQEQGEGIGVAPDGRRVYLSSEGMNAPVLEIALPQAAAQPSATPTPGPSESEPPTKETSDPAERDLWPWALGGIVGVAIVIVLIRSLRPR